MKGNYISTCQTNTAKILTFLAGARLDAMVGFLATAAFGLPARVFFAGAAFLAAGAALAGAAFLAAVVRAVPVLAAGLAAALGLTAAFLAVVALADAVFAVALGLVVLAAALGFGAGLFYSAKDRLPSRRTQTSLNTPL